ncbi:MAG: hypothetical protein M1834_005153 [Cirrosporium novae-zelandiae]|nr:MAG: hypothetical protein M1834_005153 [Cirrosporium novae-zelandiae]
MLLSRLRPPPSTSRALRSFTSHSLTPRRSDQKRPLRIPRVLELSPQQPEPGSSNPDSTAHALHHANPKDNSLLSPVYVPEDPNGVLKEQHPASSLLANSAVVIQRQLELINVMIGFEQANRYTIMDPQGNHIGFMAEQEHGLTNLMARQWFRTHRSFTTHVFDKYGKEVLRFHRPFSWISSRIRVYDSIGPASLEHTASNTLHGSSPSYLSTDVNKNQVQASPLTLSDMRIIGEAQQQWAPLRRKYNLFLYHEPPNQETSLGSPQQMPEDISAFQQLQVSQASQNGGHYVQFAYVNEPFLSWDFSLFSATTKLIGSVNRNWAGIGREMFTDTGVYALRMDAAGLAEEPGHLVSHTGQDKSLAYDDSRIGMTLDQRAVMLATAISVDFDYFSRHSGGGGLGLPLWLPGEAAAEGGTGGAAGGASEAGAATRGVSTGAGESAAAGAGALAGYEAMRDRHQLSDDNLPPSSPEEKAERDRNGKDGWNNGNGGGDEEDGDNGGFDFDDFFGDD